MLYIQSRKDDCFITHTYIQVVLEGHIATAAMEYFRMESPDDLPSTVIEILKKECNKQAKFQEMFLGMVKKCESSNPAYSCQTKEQHP